MSEKLKNGQFTINPKFMHIIEDCIQEGMSIDAAIEETKRMWDAIPDPERDLADGQKWQCPRCKQINIITKETVK